MPTLTKLRLLAIPAVALAAGAAKAEVPAEAMAAITDFGTSGLAVATAVMVAGIGIWGVKKLASKFGWF